jgi:uncharacterized membrane protein
MELKLVLVLTPFLFLSKLGYFLQSSKINKMGGVSMKKQNQVSQTDKKKMIAIMVLFGITIIIMLSGIYFSIFSVVNDISFKVINANIHGVVFGILVFYLGMRYNLSVIKLKTEINKNTSNFSWSNFKKEKSHKALS